jgi:hypothetical protein
MLTPMQASSGNQAPRIAMQAVVVWMMGLFFCGLVMDHAAGQPPLSVPQSATPQELEQVVVPLSDAVKKRIAAALAQDASRGAAPGGMAPSSGDPILDDVLDVIRRQGSVLDGSSLDPKINPANGSDRVDAPIMVDPRSAVRQSPNVYPMLPSTDAFSVHGPDARFHVAELLLRAARELAALPDRDAQRNRIISAMREQATVLMIDEFSQDSTAAD